MASRMRRILVFVLGQVPTVLVLAALGGLAWWGDNHDWKIGPRKPPPGKSADGKKDDKDEPPGKESKGPPPAVAPLVLASDESAEKAGLEFAPARSETISEYVRASAVLAFDQGRYAQLATRAPGAAWRVYRQVGERVSKGEALLLVSSAELGKVKADLLQSLVQVEVKSKALARFESAGDSVPERQIIAARTELREARIRLLADQQALANLGVPFNPPDVQGRTDEQIAHSLRLLGLPESVILAEAGGLWALLDVRRLSRLAAEVDRLPANLLPLKAPFAGQIIRRDVVAGEMVTPDRPQFVVADLSRLWLMLDVRLEDVGRLKLGQEVTFHSDSTGQSARGKLSWIAAEVDPKTRTVRARAEVNNPGERLRPATFGMAAVQVRETAKAVSVPDEAIQWNGQGHWLFVKETATDKKYQPRLVVPGTSRRGRTELLDPRLLQAASAVGLFGAPLVGTTVLPVSEAVLQRVGPGAVVVTTGSHALKAELLKDRIGGAED